MASWIILHLPLIAIDDRAVSALQRAEICAAQLATEAAVWDRTGRVPQRIIDELAEVDLLGVPFADASSHGSQMATGELLQILTAMGGGDLSVGRLYEGHINAGLLVQRFGNAAQRQTIAHSVCRRGALLAVWNTDAAAPTQLIPDGASWRLGGAKRFASGAGLVDLALITAHRPDGQRQMVLVPGSAFEDRIDLESWRPLGVRASMSFQVDFDGLQVEPNALLGKAGDYLAEPWFSSGCIRFSAVQLGGALAILRVVHAHLQAAGRHQDALQQERFARMRIAVEGGRLWLERLGLATDIADRADNSAELPDLANMCRHAVQDACELVLNLSVQSVGAQGMLAPHPLERLVRDLMTYLRQPAPDAALVSVGRRGLETKDAPW